MERGGCLWRRQSGAGRLVWFPLSWLRCPTWTWSLPHSCLPTPFLTYLRPVYLPTSPSVYFPLHKESVPHASVYSYIWAIFQASAKCCTFSCPQLLLSLQREKLGSDPCLLGFGGGFYSGLQLTFIIYKVWLIVVPLSRIVVKIK